MPADRKTPTQILAEMRRADPALDLAYQAHNEYLDADSADAGPIEDYIAKAIRSATADLERRLAEAEGRVAELEESAGDPCEDCLRKRDKWKARAEQTEAAHAADRALLRKALEVIRDVRRWWLAWGHTQFDGDPDEIRAIWDLFASPEAKRAMEERG